ncbi:MAG: PilZ domain-containing protein [Treponema sp.]|jgi:hypothetical protein|nr:PilZ domain-containing protein [Treponema sp.]
MQEKRQHIRYLTKAQAGIPGIFESGGLLKDISITGCCIECTRQVNIQPNNQYTIQVSPEPNANIGKFDLLAESRWIRPKGDSYEMGFMIVESPKGKQFQRYVDYLAWRAS